MYSQLCLPGSSIILFPPQANRVRRRIWHVIEHVTKPSVNEGGKGEREREGECYRLATALILFGQCSLAT
jgi:hypothetical protein